MNFNDEITRATSAPPMAEHVGASMFGEFGWGLYQHVGDKTNPRLPAEAAARPGGIAQPRPQAPLASAAVVDGQRIASPRPHPGTIGTPVQHREVSPLGVIAEPPPRPKSVVDLIQEDFPRTPSPVFPGLGSSDAVVSAAAAAAYEQVRRRSRAQSASQQHYPTAHSSSVGANEADYLNASFAHLAVADRHPPSHYDGAQLDYAQNIHSNSGDGRDPRQAALLPQQQQPAPLVPPPQQHLPYYPQQMPYDYRFAPPHAGSSNSGRPEGSPQLEVLFNSRGEPVGYGHPQQHHLSHHLGSRESSSHKRENNGGAAPASVYYQMLEGYPPSPPQGHWQQQQPMLPAAYVNHLASVQQQRRNDRSGYAAPPSNSHGGGSKHGGRHDTREAPHQHPNSRERVGLSDRPPTRGGNGQERTGPGRQGGGKGGARGDGESSSWQPQAPHGGRPRRGEGNERRDDRSGGGRSPPRHSPPRHSPPRNSSSGSSSSSGDRLLDEFRASGGKGRTFEVASLAGAVVAFCLDQHGSRFIQQKLEAPATTVDEKAMIFSEVLPRAHELMSDVFGNYVVQKLLEHGTPAQKHSILNLLQGHLVPLSRQMYGCRVVQKALECCDPQLLVPLARELSGAVLDCVHDQNGNHVVQKLVEVMSKAGMGDHVQFAVDAFEGQVKALAAHPYGCRVVQRILEHCVESQRFRVLDELMASPHVLDDLVRDQYGNYVVQHVIQYGRPADRAAVLARVKRDLFVFAQHKFASNVVEKCLQFGGAANRTAMVDELLSGDGGPHSQLMVLIRDQYANYVVQKLIDLSDDRQMQRILHLLHDQLPAVRRCAYGKHIVLRLERATGQRLDALSNSGGTPSAPMNQQYAY